MVFYFVEDISNALFFDQVVNFENVSFRIKQQFLVTVSVEHESGAGIVVFKLSYFLNFEQAITSPFINHYVRDEVFVSY